MRLTVERYLDYKARIPATGQVILAQYDDQHITVYQAYNHHIADYAIRHQRLGGYHFSFERMSWIKPNFLWMMYRCGWASKENQECVLAITIQRAHFDQLLQQAIHSSFIPSVYRSLKDWQSVLKASSVRLQWDPDHHPSGAKLERRAIQLGLRNDILRQFATQWIQHIEDITPFVHEQGAYVASGNLEALWVIHELEYRVQDTDTAQKLGVQ